MCRLMTKVDIDDKKLLGPPAGKYADRSMLTNTEAAAPGVCVSIQIA
jgi:hypothetical protein